MSAVDSPCALLVDIAASVRVPAKRPRSGRELQPRGTHTASTPETHTAFTPATRAGRARERQAPHAIDAPTVRAHVTHAGGGGPPGGFGGGFGGNVFPTPGEETGFFFMLPKKKNSATQNEKTTLKTKKNRKAEKHLKLGLPALKLAIAQNPIKGFFKAFFDFSPAEGSVTYAENTVSTRK